jgi:hypothetical protein
MGESSRGRLRRQPVRMLCRSVQWRRRLSLKAIYIQVDCRDIYYLHSLRQEQGQHRGTRSSPRLHARGTPARLRRVFSEDPLGYWASLYVMWCTPYDLLCMRISRRLGSFRFLRFSG